MPAGAGGGERLWTEDEARAYLPRLRLLLGVIQRAAHLAVDARGNGHASLPGSSRAAPRPPAPPASSPGPGNGGDAGRSGARGGGTDAGEESDEAEDLPVAFDAEAALEELRENRIVLRDPERGLIDFPAAHAGREVLLCWQLGEEDLAWWHFPEDGFAGRRPLPLPPES